MKEHVNFYEDIDEALKRLRGTTVLYDGEPYYVYSIGCHKPDGIFRAYLYPVGGDPKAPRIWPNEAVGQYPHNSPNMGAALDNWMNTDQGKKSGFIRKKLNSPLFNRFKPYPLGMCNFGNKTYYIERQPNRKTEQGLIRSMLDVTQLTAATTPDTDTSRGYYEIDMLHPAFRDCILNAHPTAQDCLSNLLDPKIVNVAAGFNRNFAFVRGPIGMIFLAYKSDIVGVLPNHDIGTVRLGREFRHTKEAVEQLGLFNNIQM